MRKLPITLLLSLTTLPSFSQDNYRALAWSQQTAYFANLMFKAHEQYSKRQGEFNEALASEAKMKEYCRNARNKYRKILGEMPEPCPLDAKITGRVQQKGFSVEKILYKSTKGRYVTANLYLPDGKGKHPAVVMMCGHGLSGKAPGDVEPLLARNGIAVMVVDPIGQGERWQLMDSHGNYATRGVTTEHTLLNAGCVVVGTSLAALHVWDNSVAVSYLLTRNDIDGDNIGACGSSGGGTETAYLIGFDDRIKAATICSYFSSRERTLELLGPSDGCQHVPGEGVEGLELEDFALMIAPRPVLLMTGKYDFVDYWGAVNGYHNLQKAYSVLGAPTAVNQIVVETGHGMGKEKRDKMTRFFKHWLCHEDSTDIIDDESKTFGEEESFCTPKHQVNLSYQDAVSIPQSNLSLSERYKGQRDGFVKLGYDEQKDIVMNTLGLTATTGSPKMNLTKKTLQRDYTEYRYEIIKNGQMPIPVVVLYPDVANQTGKIRIVLDDMGKSHFLSNYENYHSYITEGTIVIAADLCGCGETEDIAYFTDPKYWNQEYRTAMTSLHIGKPLMGQRVEQILTLVNALASDSLYSNRDINVSAYGLYGPAVVHASFLSNAIKDAEIQRSIKSFNEFNQNPLQRDMFSNVLVGVLRHYDLPDLVKSAKAKIHYRD